MCIYIYTHVFIYIYIYIYICNLCVHLLVSPPQNITKIMASVRGTRGAR